MRVWQGAAAAGWIVLGIGACVSPVPAQPPTSGGRGAPIPGQELDRVVAAYNDWVSGIQTVSGGGKAVVGAPGEKDRSFSFSLVMAHPSRVRLQGRLGNLTTLFDLAAVAEGWTLFFPREHQVARSSDADAAAGLLLPPRDLVAVALPLPIDPVHLRTRGAVSRDDRGVRVALPGGEAGDAHRVLWIDPRSGAPRRLELRRRSQLEAPALVAEFDDYAKTGDEGEYPRRIEIHTLEGGWALFTLKSVTLNRKVDDRRFSILVPPGTETIALEAIDPEFLPESEKK